MDALILDDLDHITTGVYNLVAAEGDSVRGELLRSLRIARTLLDSRGGLSFSGKAVEWRAQDQFSKAYRSFSLPEALLGTQSLPRHDDFETPCLFVDEAAGLLGVTVTIFPRMNADGDMLRIATTVPLDTGKRAVGTYIPRGMPDGSPNPVLEEVMAGRIFTGRALVVDTWYLTAYEALRDSRGGIHGMLYVGLPQSTVESRIRAAIVKTKIGKTGYVYVVSGKGERRGRYVISQGGLRDGEDIWSVRDSDGRYVTRGIIEAALALAPGEQATVRYRWQNPGEASPRMKIARIARYEPWDWVIGTSAYEDELEAYRRALREGRWAMARAMTSAGMLIVLAVSLAAFHLAGRISRPMALLAESATSYTEGRTWRHIAAESTTELAALSEAMNSMTLSLDATVAGLKSALSQKETLLREVHHRVKNNLQILMNLLSLEARGIRDTGSAAALADFGDRVRAMALIHEQVYASEDVQSVDMLAYCRAIAGGLYQEKRARFQEAELRISGEPVHVALDRAISLGLLLNELIANVFEHAFPPDRVKRGILEISLSAMEDQSLRIELSDNGIGMSETPAKGDPGSRLGLILADMLAKQIDARLARMPGVGTRYLILVPGSSSLATRASPAATPDNPRPV